MMTPHLNKMELGAGYPYGVHQEMAWVALMKGVYSTHTAAPCCSPAHGKGDWSALAAVGVSSEQSAMGCEQ